MKRFVSLSVLILAIVSICLWGIAWKKPATQKISVYGKQSFEKEVAVGIPVTLSAVTNASGIITVTYQNPYTVTPNIQANIVNQTSTGRQLIRIYNNTPSGFTAQVYQQSSVLPALLGIEILLAATTNVPNANVDFLITSNQ